MAVPLCQGHVPCQSPDIYKFTAGRVSVLSAGWGGIAWHHSSRVSGQGWEEHKSTGQRTRRTRSRTLGEGSGHRAIAVSWWPNQTPHPCVLLYFYDPSSQEAGAEDCAKFEASLGYKEDPVSKKRKKNFWVGI